MTPNPIQYAGFWRRLGAAVADLLLLFSITAPLLYLFYGHAYFSWAAQEFDLFYSYGSVDVLLTRIIPVIAIVLFWVRQGATPGKRLMHCRVVDVDSHQKPSARQAITRLLCYAVSSLPMNLGFFWIGWDKRKQGFHDKLARTTVLYAPDDYSAQPLHELMQEAR